MLIGLFNPKTLEAITFANWLNCESKFDIPRQILTPLMRQPSVTYIKPMWQKMTYDMT